MESSTLEHIQNQIKGSYNNQTTKEFYGPPIIAESKIDFFKRKFRREFLYCKVKNKIFSY